MVTRIGFDESGNTGEDLLNWSQPVYVLASVRSKIQLETLIGGAELKFSQCKRSGDGRKEILRIVSSSKLNSDSVKATAVHKVFMVCLKFFDVLNSPQFDNLNLDFTANGFHLKLANTFHWMSKSEHPREYSLFLKAFVAMVRSQSIDDVERFYGSLESLEKSFEGKFVDVFEYARLSRSDFEDRLRRERLDQELSELDPAVPTLNALVQEWTREIDGYEMYHDESKEIRRLDTLLSRLWTTPEPSLKTQIWNGSSVQFPTSIENWNLVDSQNYPLVQIADVVAGTVCTIFNSMIMTVKDQKFLSELRSSRWQEFLSQSNLWPHYEWVLDNESVGGGFISWHPEQPS